MKAYVITTATIFGILAVSLLWRMLAVDRSLATSPTFVAVTAISGAMCLWALVAIARANR